jgi:hypothetical protein
MPSTHRLFLIGCPMLLAACANYEEAVECTGVYGAFAEQDSGFVRLQHLAESDATKKGRSAGRTTDQIAKDIKAAKYNKREELAGQSWRTNRSRGRCDALYE